MDSLVANYASSDDDEEAESSRRPPPPKLPSLSTALHPPKSSSVFSSLPPPRTSTTSPSSTLLSSLPPPRFQLPSFSPNDDKKVVDEGRPSRNPPSFPIFSSLPPPEASSSPSSSIFSSLPPPKSQSLDQNPKRVVQFTLPLNPSILKSQNLDDDDDEEIKERKSRTDASSSSAPKSLSSILPAPKNSLGMAPAHSLGGSRRSILQADAPSVNLQRGASEEEEMSSFAEDVVYGEEQGAAAVYDTHGSYSAEQEVSGHENCANYDVSWSGGAVDDVAAVSVDSTYASNPGWEQAYGNDVGYGNYMNNWSDVSGEVITSDVLDIGRIAGKRGRADMPKEILEVKQDELMKNRPREDQVKLTGIAFGPAYQSVPSAKGKPTKLHKRKHQIGSLYYDMRQKEMELAERRSKGLLTKSETQAKYGW